jgi:hypothetical protein
MKFKKIIKEELEDDWSWTQEYPNIWLSYQMLLFDETPTKGEVIKFINDALNSGLVGSASIDSWKDEGVENESEIIYNDALKGESPYLRIDLNNRWLYYGQDYQYVVSNYPKLRKINFSEAKKYSINESDFSWIDEINPGGTICDTINYLSVGDTIHVLNIQDWKNPGILHENLIAEVLEIDNCNEIMENNNSNDPTILVHFKEKYGGFTSSWYKDFNSETNKEICKDGRCMFLLCGDDGKEQKDVRITLLPKDYIKESEEDDWSWAKEPFGIPKTKEELEYFIGWYFLWDKSGKKTGMWGYDGRLWEIIKIIGKDVFYKDSKTGSNNDTDVRTFLRSLNDGSWVLVSPEGDIFDPMYNRTYNKKINESTGFEWIDDITPEDIKFKVGDTIKVKNIGNERSFLDWLGDYSSSYLRGEYGRDIIGVVNSVGQDTFTLFEVESRNRITFPNPDKFKKFRVDHKDLDLSYELLNTDY